jgi:hypothetical protein
MTGINWQELLIAEWLHTKKYYNTLKCIKKSISKLRPLLSGLKLNKRYLLISS